MAARILRPLNKGEFDYWRAQHLLNRAGFGGTPSQVRALANMGLEPAVNYIIDADEVETEPIEADRFDADIMRPPTRQQRLEFRAARENGDEATLERYRRERQRRQGADRRQIAELQRWWLKRMIETPRPLQEKMTLFWHGHFATGYRTIEDSYHMFQQNQLFRYHALGNFRRLTHAIIRDPAMIRYLDNNLNRKQSPNENLARELMELFTLGEGNDYTETDIKQGARALTGYTYVDDQFIRHGSPHYQRLHDDSVKHILGKIGNWDGDDFVDIILSRDVCSEFICWKLYRFFVNDMPGEPTQAGQEFVLELAKLFRSKDFDLKPILRTIFESRHFYEPDNVCSQIKSPVQLVVQAIRSLRTPPRSLRALLSATDLMGQNILYPPSVKGWEGGRSWINTATMFVRQNILVYLLTGQRPGVYPWQIDQSQYDAAPLLDHFDKPLGDIDASEAVKYLVWFNLGRKPHERRIAALMSHVQSRGGRLNEKILIELLALITAMPEYQLC